MLAPMTYRHLQLPPEPFGRKLTRAREDIAKLSMEVLADRISLWHHCNPATISRLERRSEPMPNANRTIDALRTWPRSRPAPSASGARPSASGVDRDLHATPRRCGPVACSNGTVVAHCDSLTRSAARRCASLIVMVSGVGMPKIAANDPSLVRPDGFGAPCLSRIGWPVP